MPVKSPQSLPPLESPKPEHRTAHPGHTQAAPAAEGQQTELKLVVSQFSFMYF